MKFNEKLILIMKCLKINNIVLAKACKIDPTVISKYRCGSRIPTQNSNALNNLVNGICYTVIAQNKENDIYKLCKKESNLFSSIMHWFCEDESSIRLSKVENGLIGENLSVLMKLLNISNVELAKYLNKDYSLISKYRNNVTILLKTDVTSQKICNYFIELSDKNSSINLITSLLGIDENSDKNIIKNSLIGYLFHNKRVSSPVDNFLKSLNNFTFNTKVCIPSLNTLVSKEILNDTKQIYLGTSEFRDAVKKFLGSIALNETPTVLNLYSDENLKWMTEDKAFFNTWKTLMSTILMKKNKIRIIHNINRNLVEMFEAIECWLPLYMTGLIDSYYCKKSSNNRFNHTLFLAKDSATIYSYSVRGAENLAIYNYSNSKNVIKQCEEQYSSLLENCTHLVKIYINDDINKRLKNIVDYKSNITDKFENIEILSKKDVSTFVLKTDTPSIMFEFEHPSMVDAFENYISTL